MAYLLKARRAAELARARAGAIARFKENRQLRETLEGRKIIERAKGMLMARFGLTEEEAFRRLRRAAMDSRKPMVEIARALRVSESVVRGVPKDSARGSRPDAGCLCDFEAHVRTR